MNRTSATPSDPSRYLTTNGYGTLYLSSTGATVLAADLRAGDLPAHASDWAGGFYGVDMDRGDGTTVGLGYDEDDTEAQDGTAWTVFLADPDGDVTVVATALTLAEATGRARALLTDTSAPTER